MLNVSNILIVCLRLEDGILWYIFSGCLSCSWGGEKGGGNGLQGLSCNKNSFLVLLAYAD